MNSILETRCRRRKRFIVVVVVGFNSTFRAPVGPIAPNFSSVLEEMNAREDAHLKAIEDLEAQVRKLQREKVNSG
jgi:hypothetical protein